MCGHVGIAGDMELKDENTLKRMLILDYFRGPDSTGVAAIRNNNDVHIAKIASHPLDLFDTNRFKKAMSGFTSKAFIGHNRLATKGKVNEINAHPFHCGHIIGAHNGTLEMSSWKELDKVLGYETEVDSRAIFECMAKIGVEETIPLLKGAWALVWFDLSNNTLNFLRNDQRTFWYAYTDDFKKVLWASEYPMIFAAVNIKDSVHNAGYKLFTSDDGKSFWATKADWWYRFDMEKLSSGSKDRPLPRVKELKGKETVYSSSSGGCGNFPMTGNSSTNHGKTGTTTGSTNSLTTLFNRKNKNEKVIDVEGNMLDPWGAFLSSSEFKRLAKYGCSWCGEAVNFTDIGTTVWEDSGHVLCPSCTGHDHNRLMLKNLSERVDTTSVAESTKTKLVV